MSSKKEMIHILNKIFHLKVFVEMIRAVQNQKVFRYNLIKEFRVAVMQTGKKMVLNILLDIANELPVGDCLTLIESNLPLVATLFTSTWTTNKVTNIFKVLRFL